jgi:hypothetical protein
MEFSLYDYDEFIKKKCGRMSLLNQAKTGYKTKGQFEEAYNDLYTNPKIQREFGVEELAYLPSTSKGVLNHLMTDHAVSEGEAKFTASFEPEIEGGVFVRDHPLFNKDGQFDPPLSDATGGEDWIQKYRELQERRQAEQRVLVEQAAQEEARRIAEQTTQRELDEYYSKRIDMSGLGSARKEARERQGFKYSYTDFVKLPSREAKVEHLVERFFGGDASAFVDWQISERQAREEGLRPGRFELPEARRDLQGEFAAEAAEAFVPQPPEEPPEEPASPRVGIRQFFQQEAE